MSDKPRDVIAEALFFEEDIDDDARSIADDVLEALADAGLRVVPVEPSEKAIEQMVCAFAWGQIERPVDLQEDEQMARAMAGNPPLVERARAAYAAIMAGGDDDQHF